MKKILIGLILSFTLSTLVAFADESCKNDSKYPDISYSSLTKNIKNKSALIIDVNSAESYSEAHIPTALHFAQIQESFAEHLPKDKNKLIIAYCGGPMCTAWKRAAHEACKLGYKNIRHFKGGISTWKKKTSKSS